MNNAFIVENTLEEPINNKPLLREREVTLIKIIEALEAVNASSEWRVLKENIFDGLIETLDRKVLQEAKKDEPDLKELGRLNGQLVWAKKYADLKQLSEFYRVELKGLREQLNK